jgi:peroxiredoxin
MNKLVFAILMLVGGGAALAEPPPWIGLQLGAGTFGGAKIKSVIPGSPGQRAGIIAGDEVLSIDDRATESPQAVIESVKAGGVGHAGKVRLVDGKGHTRTVTVSYEARPNRETMQRNALVGRPAPDFVPSVQVGDKVPRLSSLRGKVVVIDFFATWCGPCIETMPHVEELHKKLKSKGLVVLGVSNEEPATVAHAAERFHVTYPLASDSSDGVSASYQVFALPTMVVVDKQGVVREVAIADTDAIDSAVKAALGGK